MSHPTLPVLTTAQIQNNVITKRDSQGKATMIIPLDKDQPNPSCEYATAADDGERSHARHLQYAVQVLQVLQAKRGSRSRQRLFVCTV